MERKALLPFAARRLRAMIDSTATLAACSIITGAVLTVTGSDYSPISFEQNFGEVVSVQTDDKSIPTIVIQNGEDQNTYKLLGTDWVNPSNVGQQFGSNVTKTLSNLWVGHQLGQKPEGELTINTWVPHLK